MNEGAQSNDLKNFLSAEPVRTMSQEDVLKAIPHRPPFLFVDSVDVVEEGVSCVGTKHLSPEESFFKGHFPGKPVMPGVLMVEALAQTCAALAMTSNIYKGKIAYFIVIDNVKFRQSAFPGQTLKLAVRILRSGGKVGKARGEAFCEGKLAAEADMTFAFSDK